MKKLSFAVAAALAMCAAGSASAADGTINFTGRIVASTCAVDIEGAGGTAAIALGEVNPGTLAGKPEAGEKKFKITLKAGTTPATCSKNNAELVINTTDSDLTADGMIKNTLTSNNTNAVVKLLNGDASNSVIDLNAPGTDLVRAKASSEFTYNLVARYHVVGAADVGAFAGKLVFDVDNY